MEDERMVVVEEEMVMITITWQKGEGMETGKKVEGKKGVKWGK